MTGDFFSKFSARFGGTVVGAEGFYAHRTTTCFEAALEAGLRDQKLFRYLFKEGKP